jgi:hypothetical protein
MVWDRAHRGYEVGLKTCAVQHDADLLLSAELTSRPAASGSDGVFCRSSHAPFCSPILFHSFARRALTRYSLILGTTGERR